MAQHAAASEGKERAAVFGVRVTSGLRTKIKVEAATRGLTIAELFEEIWQGYLERPDDRRR